MSSTATRKFRPTANPEFNQAMQLIGRSSATQKHDSRPNRQRSRHAAKRAAISRGGW
jgi:hypothetical protein